VLEPESDGENDYHNVVDFSDGEVRSQLVSQLLSLFKDMGKLHHFLGMKILQDENSENIWIGQPAYISKILHSLACRIASQLAHLLILGQSLRNFPTVKTALINNIVDLLLYLG